MDSCSKHVLKCYALIVFPYYRRTIIAISQKGPDSICRRLQLIDTVKLLKIYETGRLKCLNFVLSAEMDTYSKTVSKL